MHAESPTFLAVLAASCLQFSLKFILRSRYRWLLFNRDAGGSIGGGLASFLCLKRLSVLSCLVRSTSTTFRSNIFNVIDRRLSTRFSYFFRFLCKENKSNHWWESFNTKYLLSRVYIKIWQSDETIICINLKTSFVAVAYRDTYRYRCRVLIYNREPARRWHGTFIITAFFVSVSVNIELVFIFQSTRWSWNSWTGRKGTIVTDSVRRMRAKFQHLLVRISPDVIVYHVIRANEYKKC